jgi:hypothetical protein
MYACAQLSIRPVAGPDWWYVLGLPPTHSCLLCCSQLSVLAQENSTLKRREAALQSAVSSLAGSVSAATKAVLVSSEAEAADALRTTLESSSPDVRCSISDHKSFLLRMQQREAAVQVRSDTC